MRAALTVTLLAILGCRSDEPAPAVTAVRPPTECERSCEAAGSCLLAPDRCVERCEADAEIRRCITVAGDCAARASCLLQQFCGAQVPSGTGTCMSALTCARSCTDLPCVCGCAVSAHSRHTLALARAGQCVVNCNFEETCAKARCLAVIQACALQ